MASMADDNPEARIVKPNFTKVADGLLGAEGPVFNNDGKFYMVAPEVEVAGKAAGQVVTVDISTGKVTLLVAPVDGDEGGIPAGCQCDPDNVLWVADMRLGILKISPDGTYSQVAKTDSNGDLMQGCNDCSMDYKGNLWVTAPAGKIAPHPYTRSMQEPFGSVYCHMKSGEVVKVATGFQFCNGLAVQHMADGRPNLLIIAETPTKTLWAFDIVGPGKVQNKRVWGKIPGDHEGGPDGMDFDSEGNLLVANWGSSHIEVFSPQGGEPCARIQCPFSKPSNIHFKPDSTEVYVTEHENHALWKFNWEHNGRKEYCELLMM